MSHQYTVRFISYELRLQRTDNLKKAVDWTSEQLHEHWGRVDVSILLIGSPQQPHNRLIEAQREVGETMKTGKNWLFARRLVNVDHHSQHLYAGTDRYLHDCGGQVSRARVTRRRGPDQERERERREIDLLNALLWRLDKG